MDGAHAGSGRACEARVRWSTLSSFNAEFNGGCGYANWCGDCGLCVVVRRGDGERGWCEGRSREPDECARNEDRDSEVFVIGEWGKGERQGNAIDSWRARDPYPHRGEV